MADSAAAILEIEVELGGPDGIPDDFVELDGAAVGDDGSFGGALLAHPGDILVASVQVGFGDGGEVLAGLRLVHHECELVAAAAFFVPRAHVKERVAVVHVERRLDIVLFEFDAVVTFAIHAVLEVASALDFPAAVDVAAGTNEASGGAGE